MLDTLVGCVGPAGGAPAVFPSGDTQICERLGLIALDPSLPEEQARAIAFQDALSDRLDGLGCLEAAALAEIIADELDRVDLSDWTVSVSGKPAPELHCAVPRPEPADRQVVIELLPDIWITANTSTVPEGA